MRLVSIPDENYEEYRLSLMFQCYKWDPQFLDSNTIAKYALVITKEEHEELKRLTEELDKETRAAEEFLNQHQEFLKPLALPKKVCRSAPSSSVGASRERAAVRKARAAVMSSRTGHNTFLRSFYGLLPL